jgi:membrane protein YdbS with pleckstrin-like domain
MLDWLTWPANLLLSAGADVASWFVSKDAPSFLVIQMMVATLVLAAVVSLIVYWQSWSEYWSSRWQTPRMKRRP